MTAAIIPIIRGAVPTGVSVGRRVPADIADDPAGRRFVQVRADVQNHATPLSRYCRVGLTVWCLDSTGRARVDEAFDLSNVAVRALLESRDPAIIHAEWASGPTDTLDTTGKVEVAYSTVLLEVVATL